MNFKTLTIIVIFSSFAPLGCQNNEQKNSELPIVKARYLRCFVPQYPKTSIERGEEGKVVASLLIDANGKVKEAQIIESSGFALLDAATIENFLKCEFYPAIQGGKPVQNRQRMATQWKIEDKKK